MLLRATLRDTSIFTQRHISPLAVSRSLTARKRRGIPPHEPHLSHLSHASPGPPHRIPAVRHFRSTCPRCTPTKKMIRLRTHPALSPTGRPKEVDRMDTTQPAPPALSQRTLALLALGLLAIGLLWRVTRYLLQFP